MRHILDIRWLVNNYPWLAEIMQQEMGPDGIFKYSDLKYEYDKVDTVTIYDGDLVLCKASNVKSHGDYYGRLEVMHRVSGWEYFCDDFWAWCKEQTTSNWEDNEGDRSSIFTET